MNYLGRVAARLGVKKGASTTADNTRSIPIEVIQELVKGEEEPQPEEAGKKEETSAPKFVPQMVEDCRASAALPPFAIFGRGRSKSILRRVPGSARAARLLLVRT